MNPGGHFVQSGSLREDRAPTSSLDECLELSVVMPCLNEHETVGICVQKALKTLREAGIKGEVIVADNGSTDGSTELARLEGALMSSTWPIEDMEML